MNKGSHVHKQRLSRRLPPTEGEKENMQYINISEEEKIISWKLF